MNRIACVVVFAGALLASGCVSTRSSLPEGAQLVGGGLLIEWTCPQAGTAILIEATSGRPIATATLDEGEDFNFDMTMGDDAEALKAALSGIPTDGRYLLYFVPQQSQ